MAAVCKDETSLLGMLSLTCLCVSTVIDRVVSLSDGFISDSAISMSPLMDAIELIKLLALTSSTVCRDKCFMDSTCGDVSIGEISDGTSDSLSSVFDITGTTC